MRDLRELDEYRIDGSTDEDREFYGCFVIKSKTSGQHLRIIASTGMDWDHISVSMKNRCPNWHEMEQVKRLFFKDDEMCWQYHMKPKDHIDIHPFCLHIWRKNDFEMPLPPVEMV